MEEIVRPEIPKKKRVVVKVGSSSLVHPETGGLDYTKLEVLVRELCDISNKGIDVILVSSGAIAVGKKAIGTVAVKSQSKNMGFKQACAAIGQARLMMVYQKLFSLALATSASAVKPSASFTAISASILRLISTSASLRPYMNLEYERPFILAAALIRAIQS